MGSSTQADQNMDPQRTPGPDGDREASEPMEPEVEPAASAEEVVERLREENRAMFDRLARLTAEFQNSRKRLEADMEQRLQYANAQLIKALLPAIDNFERALSVDPSATDATAILKGMQIVHDQLMAALAAQEVEEIAPAPGTPFDPSHHEALMQQPTDQYPEPTVTQLFQKGYALRGRTLRPAQVAVSRTE